MTIQHPKIFQIIHAIALADTGAQMVAAGLVFARSLGVTFDELFPVELDYAFGVAGNARILGGMFIKISATDAAGNTLTAKYVVTVTG